MIAVTDCYAERPVGMDMLTSLASGADFSTNAPVLRGHSVNLFKMLNKMDSTFHSPPCHTRQFNAEKRRILRKELGRPSPDWRKDTSAGRPLPEAALPGTRTFRTISPGATPCCRSNGRQHMAPPSSCLAKPF